MKPIKTIVKTYSGANRRELLPKKSEIAGVVGDNLTTKFVFKIPAEYEGWNVFIRWHCTVTDDNGQTIVNPVYPLEEDCSFTLPGELIPDTDMIVGYNLTFYGSDDEGNELVENSITSTVYIESTREPFAAGTTEDIIRRLLEAVIGTIESLEYAEDPEAATTIQPARPYLIATTKYGSETDNIYLNVPYLNQDGYIDDRFYAPARLPSCIYILEDPDTPVEDQLTALTHARQEDEAYVAAGPHEGDLYLLIRDDPTDIDNWVRIFSHDASFSSLTIEDESLEGHMLTTDNTGLIVAALPEQVFEEAGFTIEDSLVLDEQDKVPEIIWPEPLEPEQEER